MMTEILTSAATVTLIETAAYLHVHHQAKTTAHATQACTATSHADATRQRPRVDAAEEYPGRPQTAGVPTVPPTSGAPAPPSGYWFSTSWPPLTVHTDDDTHVMEAVT